MVRGRERLEGGGEQTQVPGWISLRWEVEGGGARVGGSVPQPVG